MMHLICILTLTFALVFSPSSEITIIASTDQLAVGETVTYTIMAPGAAWLDVGVKEEMTITGTVPDCIIQPLQHAYCVMDGTDILTLTARLDRAPCLSLALDVVADDQIHVRDQSVIATMHTCSFYLPIMLQ